MRKKKRINPNGFGSCGGSMEKQSRERNSRYDQATIGMDYLNLKNHFNIKAIQCKIRIWFSSVKRTVLKDQFWFGF